MVDGFQQVAANTKEILNESVHREKTLRVRGGFEPPHLSLGTKVRHQCRIASWETMMPRWATRSSVSRKLKQKR